MKNEISLALRSSIKDDKEFFIFEIELNDSTEVFYYNIPIQKLQSTNKTNREKAIEYFLKNSDIWFFIIKNYIFEHKMTDTTNNFKNVYFKIKLSINYLQVLSKTIFVQLKTKNKFKKKLSNEVENLTIENILIGHKGLFEVENYFNMEQIEKSFPEYFI